MHHLILDAGLKDRQGFNREFCLQRVRPKGPERHRYGTA
jgi:hypothetical protein